MSETYRLYCSLRHSQHLGCLKDRETARDAELKCSSQAGREQGGALPQVRSKFRIATLNELAKRLQLAEELLDSFNSLARPVRVPLIDLDTLREGIPSRVDQQVASWRNTARLEMLATFGEGDSWRVAMGQTLSASQ